MQIMIDTHCHLTKEDYQNLDEIIEKMKEHIIIISGASHEMNVEVMEIIEKYDNVYGTLGIHPNDITSEIDEHLNWIDINCKNKKIVGIGEIGLDFHYPNYDPIKQEEIFIKQLQLASKNNLPVVIHSRDACHQTYEVLKKYLTTKGSMHCYSYDLDYAKKFIDLGLKLGIGGVLTFKNSKKLINVVENISIENLLLETDSPYLSPFRGEKNEPFNIYYVALKISELKNIPINEVIKITTSNSKEIFKNML